MSSTTRHRTILGAAVVAVLAAIPVVAAIGGGSAQAAVASPGDGTTSASAGASCWGVKQAYPASATGTYWVSSSTMDRPAQVYCDMTTDGGGWVLVGRGRNGWTFDPVGQGSAATVRTTPDGPAAFAPAALDTSTIDSLLGGTAVNALADGIRLERSTNSTGTQRQDYRVFPRAATWKWAFDAGDPLLRVRIDGTTYNGSNTKDSAASTYGQTTNQLNGVQGTRRLWTSPWATRDYVQGFAFGSGVSGGSSASTNHLWQKDREGYPLGFTRVWIRPRLANSAAGFTALPATGYAAQAKAATFGNRPEAAPWGVVGLNHTDEARIEPWSTAVFQIRTNGDRTYVAGRFNGVQQGPTGSLITQRSLAAFDLDGNWISTFRPVVDGRVWDVVVAPDGKLIIAGDFRSVNGSPNTSGLAAIDPITGATITSWKADVTRADGSRPLVRALSLRGNRLFAAGSFNRVTGGTYGQITVSSAIDLSTTDGTPGTWRPRLSGSAVRILVTDDGTRVLLSGYFNAVNGDSNQANFGIVDSTTGAVVPGQGAWSPSVGTSGTARYQQAVGDLGNGRILIGGSQHSVQLWNSARTTMIDSLITRQGGDTQVIQEVGGGKFAVGCHCGDWIYQGTNNFSSPTGFRSVDPINLVGLWDSATFEYDTSWFPSALKGAQGEGVWAVEQDARGCLWVGGDLNRGSWSGNAANDWLGGFARFCGTDATPPTAPTNLRASAGGSGVTLTWSASTDASGTPSYDISKDDRVIATVWGTSYVDDTVASGQAARYTVRATDARGNRSASPAPISVNGAPPVVAAAKAFGTSWRYLDTGADQGTAWRGTGFDDASWPSGNGTLGWGAAGVTTTIGAAKPQTAYFRSSFTIADPSQVRVLDLGVKQATGSVVYLNGVEAGRINMPTGAITATSPAAGYLSGDAETRTNRITVPGSLLRAGTNVVAVELHSMTAGASRAFFDLEATAYAATGDATAPSAPALSAAVGGTGRVDLTWTAAADDVALGGYRITRDGQPLAVTGPSATGYVDGLVDTATSHSYVVTAFDTNGNTRASNTATVTPAVAADPNLLALGSTWRWSFPVGGAAAGWNAAGFDDSTWATGAAELGFGDADEKTLITNAPKGPWPTTAYFRTTVTVTDPAAFASVLASLVRDDGAAIYVNGVEVARDNLPAGALTSTTPAATGLSTRGQETAQVALTLPTSAFRAGANTIAVEVHNFDPWSSDLSFDLSLVGRP